MTKARDLLIPLADGTHLAANLLLPAGDGPFPVLVIFYPYRKDDFIGSSCAYPSAWFAEAGYASLLVDIRGYGSSDGPAYEAWDPREARDGAEVVQWAAGESWCNGRVGIWGTSYGGLQALAVAAERPPALQAIASVYGAADIYEDFVYPGGCPNGLGGAAWSALMLALELAPPGLQDPEGRWRDVWRDRLSRLESGSLSSLIWPAHEDFDDYWRTRVVGIENIDVPAFFLSGWRDLLCRGTLEAYRRCQAPKRLLAGPWTHNAPDLAAEAPYDWLLELRQWFDRWLKDGVATPERPDAVYWVQGLNQWRSADHWPPAAVETRAFHAGPDGTAVAAPASLRAPYTPCGLVGTEAGLWFPMGVTFPDVLVQDTDDARSLCFTSPPLDHDLAVLGTPRAHLQLEIDGAPTAHICVKLCHVTPDDRSTLVTSGWLRVDPEPGANIDVEIDLYPTAYLIPAGHRVRWTLATADFPRIWPTAAEPDLVLVSDPERPSRITLPVSTVDLVAQAAFDPPMPAPVPAKGRAGWATSGRPVYRIERDVVGNSVSITAGMETAMQLPQGGSFHFSHSVNARMAALKPAAATIRTCAEMEITLASGEPFTIHTTGLSALGRRHLHGRILFEGEPIFERRWSTYNGRESTP